MSAPELLSAAAVLLSAAALYTAFVWIIVRDFQ